QKTQLATMNQMVQLAASGTAFDSAALAQVFGIQETQVQQLFGLTLAPQKTISLSDFTAFLVNDVLSNEAYANNFTEEQKTQLATMNQMVQLAASGTGLDAQTLAKTFGMEKDLIEIVFRLYFGSDISCKTMSLEETVDFILTDSVMKNYLDSARISQLQMMQKMIKATINCTEFTYHELADLLGMDDSMLKMLYTVRASESQINNWRLSMHTIINFLMDNSDMLGSMMGSDEVGSLSTAQAIINGSVNGTSYTADQISELMGMSKKQAQQLYLLYISKHGDTSGWTLSVKGFIDFIIDEVLSDSEYADRIDADTSDMLSSARTMVNAVISGDTYTAEEMGDLLSGLTDELESSMVELVYLYAESPENADPEWTMTLETLLSYMTDSVLNDSRFASVIDNDMRQKLFDAQDSLDEGRKQLVSQNYSRLIITSSYPDEGAETTAFFDNLEQFGNDKMEGEYYFVGNSAMNYEMQKTFDNELLFITLLTALAIFLIVAITFKSLSIPLILVLLVQCGVYITISITGALNGSIYYLALLVVECILMGSTVDYGILLTNYYCEARKTMDVKDALKKAYSGSIHTIMTSGLILILVTAAVGGMFNNPTVNAIIKTISMGALCATILILFVLPGVLAACDKIVTKKRNRF
ncbi:MAG: MMPL family transporter, partial [Solobacterium sp.]|nr:MMPL family transporter [Solobacterium sp.]